MVFMSLRQVTDGDRDSCGEITSASQASTGDMSGKGGQIPADLP
jgi:hypothetical protein